MNQKDIISKTLIKHIFTDVANILLHLDVEPSSVELLETQNQRVEERRADLVARASDKDTGQSKILHIEIQNHNDANMSLRMMRYYTDIGFTYAGESIHQYLIYIGKQALSMPDNIEEHNWQYRYQILDMRTIDCNILLRQDDPDALVMAILCDFKEQPPQEIVNYIAYRLKTLLQDDESGFENYFSMLQVLAQNRNLEQEIKESKTMLTEYDVTKFATYQWGMEKGMEEGIERGIEKGKELGQLQLVKQFLQLGMINEESAAQTLGITVEKLKQLLES